jgi:hypothetical protein
MSTIKVQLQKTFYWNFIGSAIKISVIEKLTKKIFLFLGGAGILGIL